ncbi:MAG TPA: hypothetical protein VFX79_01680 [Candidatus Saccharimonadales bacterium]|nr:hypothetical protein [Candidatus Saccharimonadales bacterium]
MARPVTHEAEVSIGLEREKEMAEKQIKIRESGAQAKRQSRREAILKGREAHKKVFETVFSLDPAARAKNAKSSNITFWARFHRFNEHGQIDHDIKLDPANAAANIGIIGATIAIKRDPSLSLGVDIQREGLEQRLLVAAAIKDLKSPALDVEDGEWHNLDGLYVPSASDPSIEDFEQGLYETVEYHKGIITPTDALTIDAEGSPIARHPRVGEAISVINALSEATAARP